MYGYLSAHRQTGRRCGSGPAPGCLQPGVCQVGLNGDAGMLLENAAEVAAVQVQRLSQVVYLRISWLILILTLNILTKNLQKQLLQHLTLLVKVQIQLNQKQQALQLRL